MQIILTDRSRMDTFDRCPREAFWTYYWGGTGIVPKEEALQFTFGTAIHRGLEGLLVGGVSVEQAVAEGVVGFDAFPEPLRAEQRWLFECLLRIWADHRLPALREEFDFLKIEPEILWRLGTEGAQDVVQMIRPDVLARRIADGELFYIEWKTTAYGEDGWAKKWEKNAQVLCNALAIEETLSERVAGVMIEGLIKGPRKQEWRKSSRFQGMTLQQTLLCYQWEAVDGLVSPKWSHGATHMPMWETGVTPQTFVNSLPEPRNFLVPVPPISPDREDLEDWREAAKQKMLRIQEGLTQLQKAPSGEKRRVISKYFPANFNACYPFGFGSRCSYFDACFNPLTRKDPLSAGYQLRIPHHEAERVCPESKDSPGTSS